MRYDDPAPRADREGTAETRFADHPHDLKGNNDPLLLTPPEVIRGNPRGNIWPSAPTSSRRTPSTRRRLPGRLRLEPSSMN